MFPFEFDSSVLVPLAVFAIPIVAITGGIVLGIVRSLGRQRMIELAQRERIAAIARGVDPAKLPPLDLGRSNLSGMADIVGEPSSPLRRAQGLMIGGFVTLAAGAGICVFFAMLTASHAADEAFLWTMGLIPAFVGVALLLSSWIVWPRGGAK